MVWFAYSLTQSTGRTPPNSVFGAVQSGSQEETIMSLDIALRPASTGPEELVPSRYAVKVGEIDVLVISDGVLPLPTKMLGHNVDTTERASWLNEMFLPQDAFDWSLNVVVVRSGDQTILVDAGLGLDPNLNLPRAGQLIKRLAAAGIDLAAITDVVLTHMHMDHVGGLLVEGVKDQLRPDLRIHVAAAEVKFWEAPDFSQVNMPEGFPDALRAAAARFAQEYHSHLRLFDEEYEVAPGVIVHRTGGHTPGHSVVRLASGDDRLTFAGDSIFAVGFDHPDWHNGFEHDPEEAARVRIRLMTELAASGEQLVATHLPFPSVGRVAAEGGTFRWVPAFWDY
jgi:glyoxylase-like metal-dependent hydrolase (beta-lactamase superfamily II)